MKFDEAIKMLYKLAECCPNDELINSIVDARTKNIIADTSTGTDSDAGEYDIYSLDNIVTGKAVLEDNICVGVQQIKNDIPHMIACLLNYYKLLSKYEEMTSEENLISIASYDEVKQFLNKNSFTINDPAILEIIDTYIDRLLDDILEEFNQANGYWDGCRLLDGLLVSIDTLCTGKYSRKLVNFSYNVQKSDLCLDDKRTIIASIIEKRNSLNIDDAHKLIEIKKAYNVLNTLNT